MYTLSRKKMSGESDENFEGVTKFSPDILSPDQNFYPIFQSPTKTFPRFFFPDQNFYLIFLFQQKKDFYRSFPL